MKIIRFDLDQYQVDYLLCAFREKSTIISFWMKAIKTIISHYPPEPEMIVGQMSVVIDKMQRIFLTAPGKSFTTSFPFTIKDIDGAYKCCLKSGAEINSKVSSEVLGALETLLTFKNNDVFGFADDIINSSDDSEVLWRVLSDLALEEEGYLRLDHDPMREAGNRHPLHHLDIFYSQGATFKVGLRRAFSIDDLTDLLNIKSDCHFIGQA